MAIPATGRFTAQTIKQYAVQAKADNPAKVVACSLILNSLPKDKTLSFNAQVAVTADGAALGTYDVAAGNGAVQKFKDVDTAVKTVASILPESDGIYMVSVNTGSLLDKAPSGDLVKAQAAEKARLQAQLPVVAASKAKIDAQLALMVGWESGNSLQVAKKAEETTRAAVMVALTAAINARIAALP